MRRIAVVFHHAPHGASGGREGLDALLAACALTLPGVFFVGDGVLQLLPDQQPGVILGRDYIATFKLLALYDVEDCWVCADSARARGIAPDSRWVIPARLLAGQALRQKLAGYDAVLTF